MLRAGTLRLQLPHLYFRHRFESALCFGYQTYQCLGTGHWSSLGLSSRDRYNSVIRHYRRWTSPRCQKFLLWSFSRWRGLGSELLSC